MFAGQWGGGLEGQISTLETVEATEEKDASRFLLCENQDLGSLEGRLQGALLLPSLQGPPHTGLAPDWGASHTPARPQTAAALHPYPRVESMFWEFPESIDRWRWILEVIAALGWGTRE